MEGADFMTAELSSLERIGDGVVSFRDHFVCKENIDDPINVTLYDIFLKH